MATLYKRKGTWHVDYSYCGKRIRYSLDTTDEEIARKKFKKIDYEVSVAQHNLPKRTPLEDFLSCFLNHLKGHTCDAHYRNRRAHLRAAFGPIIPELNDKKGSKPQKNGAENSAKTIQVRYFEDITVAMIGRFLDEQAHLRQWHPITYNRVRETFHLMYEYAIRMFEYVSRDPRYPNPIKAIPKRRRPAAEIRFLELPQITEQLGVLEKMPLLRAAVATMIYAGLRRGEIVWLTKEDVDLESGVLRVRAKSCEGERWEPKTKENRVVPISSDLQKVLRQYKPPAKSSWFFPAPEKKTSRWDEDNLSRMLRRVNKRHNLPWTCLDFRHTFGSHLAMNNISLYKIATLMGNSPEICRRHYAALVSRELTECVEFEHR